MPPCTRKPRIVLGNNAKQDIAGAYDAETGDLLTAAGGSKSSDLFIQLLEVLLVAYIQDRARLRDADLLIQLLEVLLVAYPTGTIHFILDNSIIHNG